MEPDRSHPQGSESVEPADLLRRPLRVCLTLEGKDHLFLTFGIIPDTELNLCF